MFIMHIFANAHEALTNWRKRHQAYTELMGLDDRSLADIGIHRSEIPAMVFNPEASTGHNPKPQGVFAAHQARVAGGNGALPPL